MKIINKTTTLSTKDKECFTGCMRFIHDGLAEAGVNNKLAIKAEMLSEEMIASMLPYATGDTIMIQVRKLIGDTVINISMKGEEFDPYGSNDDELDDDPEEELIRSMLLRAYGDSLRYSHKRGKNSVKIKAEEAQRSMMKSTLVALVLALIVGVLMKSGLSDAAAEGISNYVLTPFSTMFMNALKMVIGPVVFFSIVTCLSQFKDITELGKIGIKVLMTYIFTTIMAVIISTAVFFVFKPGAAGAALTGHMESQTVDVATDVDTSLLNTIINIVPSNFVKPFLESDTLQLIFLALICGIAVGMIGDYSKVLKDWLEACNSLFLTVTSIVAKFIPIAVFCSVTLMIYQMGGKSMLSLLSVFLTMCVSILLMLVVYGLLVMLGARLNPVTFFRKSKESMLTSFVLMSSSASLPTTMNTCTEKLGISPKVANFSIPLGATINMDGTCMYLTIFSLYLARLYGIDVSVSTVLSMALTVILLSLGAPGVPGSALVCLGIVLGQVGVPIEALGLVIAINPFTDMIETMSNVTGDIAAATLTAKTEGLLDTDVYNS